MQATGVPDGVPRIPEIKQSVIVAKLPILVVAFSVASPVIPSPTIILSKPPNRDFLTLKLKSSSNPEYTETLAL